MKRQIVVATLLGCTFCLAACGSDKAGCADDPACSESASRNERQSRGDEDQQGEDVCTTDTWGNYGQQFIADNCGQCHKGFAKYALVRVRAAKMAGLVESDQMPKTGPLPADEKARLVQYLRCGAPE